MQRIVCALPDEFVLYSEQASCLQVEAALRKAGIRYEREARAWWMSRFDFFLPVDGIVIEIKHARSSPRRVHEQVRRYARYPKVDGVLLLTPRPEHKLGLFAEETPIYSVLLGLHRERCPIEIH